MEEVSARYSDALVAAARAFGIADWLAASKRLAVIPVGRRGAIRRAADIAHAVTDERHPLDEVRQVASAAYSDGFRGA